MVKNILKKLLVVFGFISLVLGIIGTLLPVMPTIPFLFVAYFCFTRGSDKFREWYLQSKFHKKYLKAVAFYGRVPLIYKILYIVGILCFFAALATVYYFFYEHIFAFLGNIFN